MKTLWLVILSVWCFINTVIHFFDSICSLTDLLIAIGTVITALVAVVALAYSIKQYNLHREQRKISVLAKYNERYCASTEIKHVIEYLMAEEEYSEVSTVSNENKYRASALKAPERDREMFMRFFAEIQMAINAGLIDKEYAKVMFGYYAVAASNLGVKFVSDYNAEYWSLFRSFAESMRQLDFVQCLNKINKPIRKSLFAK